MEEDTCVSSALHTYLHEEEEDTCVSSALHTYLHEEEEDTCVSSALAHLLTKSPDKKRAERTFENV
jgi:D-hexose-6-phosphate mutarotase